MVGDASMVAVIGPGVRGRVLSSALEAEGLAFQVGHRLDEVAAALLPTCTGHVLREADIREHPERIARSFRDEDWSRVQQLITRFDPDGLFHGFPNHPIE